MAATLIEPLDQFFDLQNPSICRGFICSMSVLNLSGLFHFCGVGCLPCLGRLKCRKLAVLGHKLAAEEVVQRSAA